MGKQYSSEKRTEAFRGNQHTAKKSGSVQSEHYQKPMKTCERIAQENHSSASSVRRAEYYAHGVDVADELSPGFRDRFLDVYKRQELLWAVVRLQKPSLNTIQIMVLRG